ncbi:MAG: type II secretion system F family protein [Chthonomonadales bacterium]
MPDFAYIARDAAGRVVEGTVNAPNSALAAGKVRAMGYVPERLRAVEVGAAQAAKEAVARNVIYPVASGVSLKELVAFYRQFATMINAGIPLYQSLVSLEGQCRNARLAAILRECQTHVQGGGRLSEVLERYPWVFSELQLQMIRAGEQGGMLEHMLLRIADYLERELALRRLISGLTLYPKIVLFSALFILGRSFFVDYTPAISKLIIGQIGKNSYSPMDYLNDTVFFLAEIALIAFGIMALCRILFYRSPSLREGYERVKLSLPGIGSIVRGFALARFGRAFSAMYAAGLPLNSAVRIAGDASGSYLVAASTRQAVLSAERGVPLSQALAQTGVFPNLVLDMLRTGEQSGNVDAMMNKAADYLEGEAEGKARLAAHLFATGVYLLVAGFVAFAVIHFYMAYAGGAVAGGGD